MYGGNRNILKKMFPSKINRRREKRKVKEISWSFSLGDWINSGDSGGRKEQTKMFSLSGLAGPLINYYHHFRSHGYRCIKA